MSPWTVEDISDQRNKTSLITGASSGIGLSSALALAARGARVLLACRKGAKATQAHAAIAAVACGSPPRLVELELADLASVARCAKEILNSENRIDLLMLNAGVMAMPRTRTADGFEAHFGINHLGHFALAGRLMPLVLAARLPRRRHHEFTRQLVGQDPLAGPKLDRPVLLGIACLRPIQTRQFVVHVRTRASSTDTFYANAHVGGRASRSGADQSRQPTQQCTCPRGVRRGAPQRDPVRGPRRAPAAVRGDGTGSR